VTNCEAADKAASVYMLVFARGLNKLKWRMGREKSNPFSLWRKMRPKRAPAVGKFAGMLFVTGGKLLIAEGSC